MEENRLYPRMFTWLFVGLMITFISGYCLSLNETLLYNVLSIGIIPIIIIELLIAVFMEIRVKKMSPFTTKLCYIVYSITTGITFSTIFLTYKMSSIMFIFLVTAILFGIFALIGYFTKIDLTRFSTLLFIALIGIILVSILNIFIFKSGQLELILSIICIIVFLGYIAYDIQSTKYLMASIGEEKAAVYGAFQLYLDFINIFIKLLQLFGKNDN